MKYKVLALKEMDPLGHKILEQIGAEVLTAPETASEEEILDLIAKNQVDAIYSRTDKVDRAMMDASPRLKVVAKQGVGLDNIDVDYATSRRIPVVWAPGGNANAVAEHTILLMLMCAIRFRYVDEEMREGDFGVRYHLKNTWELKGQTLGLLGCGHIGQTVAKIAANGFGMTIIGSDPHPPMDPIVPIHIMSQEEVLAKADFVSLHMPSLPSTIHSISYKQFQLMKKTAFFINCARGNVVVEQDLIRALKDGTIAGAGLDVFEQEPLPLSSELFTMENVVLTPHTAASTNQSVRNCTYLACQGMVDALLGHQRISNQANRF